MSTDDEGCPYCYPGECMPTTHEAAVQAEYEAETCRVCGAPPGDACAVAVHDLQAFHAHLDGCAQCREQPFSLCDAGAELLGSAGSAAAAAWRKAHGGPSPSKGGHHGAEDRVLRRGAAAARWLKWTAGAYLAFCIVAIVQTVFFQRLSVAWPSLVNIAFSMVCVPHSVWLFTKQVQNYGTTVNRSADSTDRRGKPHGA